MKDKFINILKGFGTIILYFSLALLGGILFGKFYDSPNIVIATFSQLGTYTLILLVLLLLLYIN